MTTLTFKAELNQTEWGVIVDSDTHSSFGILSTVGQANLCIASSAPADDETQVLPLSASDTREFSLTLPTGYRVYAKAVDSDAIIHGYMIPR